MCYELINKGMNKVKIVFNRWGIQCLTCFSVLVLSNFLKYYYDVGEGERDVEIGCMCGCLCIRSNVNGNAVSIVSTKRIEPVVVYPPVIYALRQEVFPTLSSESRHLVARRKKKLINSHVNIISK